MRGSIFKRGDSYSVIIERDRDPVTGKRKQDWHAGFRTKREAERKLNKILASLDAGNYVEPTNLLLRISSPSGWQPSWQRSGPPALFLCSELAVARPAELGSVQLRHVDAGRLNALYAALLADGKQTNGGGGLSPRSVSYCHTILHRAFRDAVRWVAFLGIRRMQRILRVDSNRASDDAHMDRRASAPLLGIDRRASAARRLCVVGDDRDEAW